MYYTNAIKVTLKDTESAIKALEILRNRLDAGFEVDKIYKRMPSQNMREALEVVENTIVLPEDFGCYVTEDAESVMFELIQNLAENMGNDTFVWEGVDSNDYTDGWFDAKYENGLLNVKYTYFPSGAATGVWCEECDAELFHLADYMDGNVSIDLDSEYVCPECGEVVDLSEYLPIVTEKTVRIF